ncbi:hypothetical protein BEI60_00780 [Eisenbergiella tayi]|nr:hypothetical protein BEI60_00780 [Eisenbergiella tayi]
MKIKWLETAPFFCLPMERYKARVQRRRRGKEGAGGYPNAKGVPRDVPPVALPPDNNALKNKP